MNRILFGLLGALLVPTAVADVQLQIKDGSGSVSEVSSNGKQARIKDKRMQGYVLIDYTEEAIYMVDLQRREAIRSTLGADSAETAMAASNVRLESQGGGPRIAGYKTRKYAIKAGDENCGSVYASSDLLKLRELRSLFEAMRSLQQRSRQMMGGMSGFMSACQQASLQVSQAMEERGAPMRILDAGGNLQSEVLKVETGKSFPASHYRLPSGIKVVDLDEKMKQAGQQMMENMPDMNQMMKNMPDMNQMMEQMQQGGGQMTEEMKQQMLKLQDALKQMQQGQQ